jgi:hypothetical protein
MKRTVLLSLCLFLSTLARADDFTAVGDPNCKVMLPVSKFVEQAKWKGPCKDGYADGDGVLDYLKDGAPDGRFEGRLERGVRTEGYYVGADGMRYEGKFKNSRPDGIGVMISAGGDRYDGAWKNGRRDGMGSQSFVVGGRYDGNWKDGRFDGKGSLTYAGGHQVTGMFMQGALVDSPRPAPKVAVDPATVEHFKLQADNARVGTNLKSTIAHNDGVPFDKGYADMTPEQQAKIRARYPLLEDGDEPPYPLKGVAQHFKWVNEAAERLNIPNSKLRLLVQIDSSGKAVSVSVLETPDPKLTEVVASMMVETKFKPAICGGKPCAMMYPFYLTLNRRLM